MKININAVSTIYRSTTKNNRQTHKGRRYFWTNVPGKTQCGKTSAAILRVILLCSLSEYNWVPNQLIRQRKIYSSNTSIFENSDSEKLCHETLYGTTEAQH